MNDVQHDDETLHREPPWLRPTVSWRKDDKVAAMPEQRAAQDILHKLSSCIRRRQKTYTPMLTYLYTIINSAGTCGYVAASRLPQIIYI